MTQETPEELRLRIEQTRQELGAAVGAGIALLVLLRVLRRR
jgi:hypothetical protein